MWGHMIKGLAIQQRQSKHASFTQRLRVALLITTVLSVLDALGALIFWMIK